MADLESFELEQLLDASVPCFPCWHWLLQNWEQFMKLTNDKPYETHLVFWSCLSASNDQERSLPKYSTLILYPTYYLTVSAGQQSDPVSTRSSAQGLTKLQSGADQVTVSSRAQGSLPNSHGCRQNSAPCGWLWVRGLSS